MKAAVYFIFQPAEAAHTADFIARLHPQLGDETRAFGVLNGNDPTVLGQLRDLSDFVDIASDGTNQGVAGGPKLRDPGGPWLGGRNT